MSDRTEWLEIPLSGTDITALIDAADLSLVSGCSWQFDHGYAKTEKRRQGGRIKIYMHRLILGASPEDEVDHRNLNRLDNRRANLRFATRSQNMANGSRRRDNRSGYRGVSWYARGGKWQASIRIDGRTRNLGHFIDPAAAARAYDTAAHAIFGEFAVLNFSESRL